MSRAHRSYTERQHGPVHVPDAIGGEEWRWVVEFPEFLVSSLGRITNKDGSIKRHSLNRQGYEYVGFCVDSKTHCRLVNRVVCEAFHGPSPSSEHQAAHNDGNKINNHADNLRWATRLENIADKYIHGTHRQGDDCPWSKLSRADVEAIRWADRGTPLAQLAAKFGISKNHVAKIRTPSRGIWPDVPFLDGGANA